MKSFKLTIAICSLLHIVTVHALESSPYFCSSAKVTECLGITKQQCIQASDMAFNLCSQTYAFDPSSDDAKSKIKEVSACTGNQLWRLASVSEDTLNSCKAVFVAATNKEMEKIKKQREKSDEEFHKKYEPPKIY